SACQQGGGVHEQRVANASGAAPGREPGVAGPEAAVLELPCVRRGQAPGSVSVCASGSVVADVRLVAVAAHRGPTGEGKSVNRQTGSLRRCRLFLLLMEASAPAWLSALSVAAARRTSAAK